MFIAKIKRDREYAYPFAAWGARKWMQWSGMKIVVRGQENLAPNQSYVFISNHRSYLDTATLFFHVGQKMGLVGKKELLKVPIFGAGMSFVNIIAIDRTNPESALRSMEKAKQIMDDGIEAVIANADVGAAAEAEAVRVELITSQGNDVNHDAEKIERIRELAGD